MANHSTYAVVAILAVAFILPAIALAARDVAGIKRGFVVQGRVFCDTCRAGFETPASTYIRGEGFPALRSSLSICLLCCILGRRILLWSGCRCICARRIGSLREASELCDLVACFW